MARTLFFDITGEGGGLLYVFEKGRPASKSGFAMRGFVPKPEVAHRPKDEAFVSLPLGMLNFRALDMPIKDRKSAREVLPFELEGLILEGTENVVIDSVPLPGGPKERVLAVYTGKADLKKLLDGLLAEGIDPKAVTSVELAHALKANGPPEEAVAGGLINPMRLKEEERMGLAEAEISKTTVNLRMGGLSYSKETESTRRALRTAALLSVLFFMVFSLDIAMRTASLNRESSAIESAIRKDYAEVFPGEKTQPEKGLMYVMKSKLREMEERERLFSGVHPLRVLLELSGAGMKDTPLSEITMDGNSVTIKGEALSLSDVEALNGRLREGFGEAVISDTKKTPGEKTSFTINLKKRRP